MMLARPQHDSFSTQSECSRNTKQISGAREHLVEWSMATAIALVFLPSAGERVGLARLNDVDLPEFLVGENGQCQKDG
jgi:hypothetical protein